MQTQIDVETFRTTRRWTRSRLAEELGVDTSTVWRWENGKQPSGPVIKALEKLSEEYPPADEAAA